MLSIIIMIGPPLYSPPPHHNDHRNNEKQTTTTTTIIIADCGLIWCLKDTSSLVGFLKVLHIRREAEEKKTDTLEGKFIYNCREVRPFFLPPPPPLSFFPSSTRHIRPFLPATSTADAPLLHHYYYYYNQKKVLVMSSCGWMI